VQVQTKLKLMGIEAIYLASSGERITRLDQLQDIDELYVVEVRDNTAVPAVRRYSLAYKIARAVRGEAAMLASGEAASLLEAQERLWGKGLELLRMTFPRLAPRSVRRRARRRAAATPQRPAPTAPAATATCRRSPRAT
jgi:hypothetical protein